MNFVDWSTLHIFINSYTFLFGKKFLFKNTL